MKIMDINDMKEAHKHTYNNYEMLQEEQNCRCIYCLKEFNSTEIEEFTMDDTALCPYCLIDAVIGEKSGYSFTDEDAKRMYEVFFNTPILV